MKAKQPQQAEREAILFNIVNVCPNQTCFCRCVVGYVHHPSGRQIQRPEYGDDMDWMRLVLKWLEKFSDDVVIRGHMDCEPQTTVRKLTNHLKERLIDLQTLTRFCDDDYGSGPRRFRFLTGTHDTPKPTNEKIAHGIKIGRQGSRRRTAKTPEVGGLLAVETGLRLRGRTG